MKVILADLKLFSFLIFLSLVFLLFDNLGFLNSPKTAVQTVTVPIQYGLYKSGNNIYRQFEFLFLIRRSAQENKALRLQLAELIAKNSTLSQELRETNSLIDAYNKLSPQTFDFLPARPIGGSRFLLIDKGSNDGIAVGEAVVFKNHYIGQIKQVSPKTSEVLLSTDPDSKIAVFSQRNAGSARGILTGQFGSEALMDKILHAEEITVDDLVYSEGSEGNLPKGLIMGKVSKVLERQNEVFKQAKVEPIFNVQDLDVVFVIKNQ